MSFVKKHWTKVIIPISCLLAFIVMLLPENTSADTMADYSWTVYQHTGTDGCNPSYGTDPTEHVTLNASANQVSFAGHTDLPYFEYAIADPGPKSSIQNEFFNFSLNLAGVDYHTLTYAGFLFNADVGPGGVINSGYYAAYGLGNWAYLFKVSNADISGWNGRLTQIAQVQTTATTLHQISIQATANHVLFIDNDQILFDTYISELTGTQFGPAMAWGSHACSSISRVNFSQVQCGVNKKAPTANFNYNVPVADIKTRVYVTYSAQDHNTPLSPLTYLWTVVKIDEDGTRTTLCNNSPTPFTRYNENGIGKYETTLRVKNGYYFFAPPVTRVVEITTMPTIQIEPDKTQYYPGDTIKFNCDKWFNCSSTTGDVVIENVASKNLYAPVVGLVGSSSITSTSGDLTTDVVFEYSDGTTQSYTVAVPPAGTAVSDAANKSKQVSKITVTYKSIPKLAELSAGKYLTYTYSTQNPLSNYYIGGAASRRYEASNTVTCKINLGKKVVSVSDDATTNFIERFASFSLRGTINNNGAITQPPVCSTEFLLSGTSYGGENISAYMVVTNGSSPSIQLPYGEYTLSEDSGFTQGYDIINPISLILDQSGVTINRTDTIPNNGKVPFVKTLQVATIDVSRIYESADDIALKSSTDFKVLLTGTPVVNEIKALFELMSPSDDETYYYNRNISRLVVPIGTYSVDETQSYKLVTLRDIKVGGELLWDNTLNAKKTAGSGRVTFTADKNQSIPVVLKYISDEYVYNEDIYRNGLFVSVKPVNHSGGEIIQSNIDMVKFSPSQCKYPVTLQNAKTGDEYVAIVDSNSGKSFGYMYPGKYNFICSNNMYMDFDEMKELNSEDIEFGEENGTYYVIIPENYAYGEYQEQNSLTDWRGYSSVSGLMGQFIPNVYSHVSLNAQAVDQDGDPVKGVEVYFTDDDGNTLYFTERDGKWYPSGQTAENAVSVFKTDNEGVIHIYKFPKGEYVIHEKSPSESIFAITPTQTLIVDGKRNMGIEMEFAVTNKIRKPTSASLGTLKSSIDIGERIIIANKVVPAIAYKNVTLTSSDSNIISVDEKGIVRGVSKGTATITAKSTLDGSTIGALELSVFDSNNPELRDLRQKISNIKLEVGESYPAKAVYCPSNTKNVTVAWTSANPAIAAVDANGIITARGVGTTNIVASCNGFTAICRVTVGKTDVAVKSIEFVDDNIQLVYNNSKLSTGVVETVILPADASDPSVTYESSNPDIVSVDASGRIVAKTAGVVTITAATSNGISSTCLVSSVSIVQNITLNMNSLTLVKGTTSKVSVAIDPVTALNINNLVWTSTDPNIAAVNQSGEITAVAIGQTTVTASVTFPGTDTVSAECIVTVVTDEVQPTNLDVCLDEEFSSTAFVSPVELEIGSQKEFFARVRPATATNLEVEWVCSPSKIIEIGPADPNDYSISKPVNKWKIDAVGDSGGEVTVIGRVKGTNIQTQFKVIVDAPGTGFEFNMDSPQKLILGKSPYDVLPISIVYDNPWSSARNITWELSDDSKATLSYPTSSKKNANITACEEGIVTLTATVEFRLGGTYTKSIQVIIEKPSIDILVNGISMKEITVAHGDSIDLTIEPNYPKASVLSGYEITLDNGNVTIESNGKNTSNGLGYTITGISPGVAIATVAPTDSSESPFTFKITVPGISVVSSTVDGNIVLSVQATDVEINSDEIVWSSDNPDIATVDEFGNVTPVADGMVTFTANVNGMTAQLALNFEGISEITP